MSYLLNIKYSKVMKTNMNKRETERERDTIFKIIMSYNWKFSNVRKLLYIEYFLRVGYMWWDIKIVCSLLVENIKVVMQEK